MKNVFKFLVALVLIANFISCTDTEEITTENGEIINIQAINKGDVIAPGSEGGDGTVGDEDE